MEIKRKYKVPVERVYGEAATGSMSLSGPFLKVARIMDHSQGDTDRSASLLPDVDMTLTDNTSTTPDCTYCYLMNY